MKTRIARYFTTLMVVVLVSFLLGDMTRAQLTSPPDSLGSHHKELKFTLTATGSRTFSLPRTDFPVRIEAGTSNVQVVFNGSTVNMGPLVVSTVATFDTASGIGNMTGDSVCADGTLCENLALYVVPNSNVTGLYFSLKIDRNTGDITVSMRSPGNNVVIPPNPLSCRVSMWF